MTTINHECYVSLEVAKLLKEVGFDWECSHWYSLDGSQWITDRETNNLSPENKKRFIHCPSLDVAQRWLREVKEIEVNTLCVYINNVKKYSYSVFEGKYNNERIEEGFDTFEEALEAGEKKALEIILEKGE